MTKKEKDLLHERKSTVDAVDTNVGRGPEVRYIVCFSLTAGELLALKNALSEREGVADDVHAFLRNACARSEIKI